MIDFGDPRLPPRFWEKVRRTPHKGGCWTWKARLDRYGYGRITIGGKSLRAHRVAYAALVGDPGPELDHRCRRPACCNPAHLEPVSRRENIMRGTNQVADNITKTECIRGHALAGGNLYVTPDGKRRCRACARLRDATRRSGDGLGTVSPRSTRKTGRPSGTRSKVSRT